MAVPVLLPQSPQSCSATSAPLAAPDRAGMPGANDRGGLQLCYGKQLCPLFPPHAKVHEWSSSIVKETCETAGDLAGVLARSKMVLKGDRVFSMAALPVCCSHHCARVFLCWHSARNTSVYQYPTAQRITWVASFQCSHPGYWGGCDVCEGNLFCTAFGIF